MLTERKWENFIKYYRFKKRSFYCRTTIVTQQQIIHILGQHFTNVFSFLPILSNVNLCVRMFVCSLFITLILLHCTQRIVWWYQWGCSRAVHRSTDNIIAKRNRGTDKQWYENWRSRNTDSLTISKSQSEDVNQRQTNDTIVKRTNNDRENTAQKIKDRAKQTVWRYQRGNQKS